ncbi:MAG TPA: TonB-dependent receptor, partial [Candidatus Polarisedimenticolaceae bacterium]|nr:TonB-dependent receptor [Candidatus Polarisedimenticolaceae bacterium]
QAGGVLTLANAGLGPEKLTGVEVGGGAGTRLRAGARLFWMSVDGAILNVTLASDPTGNTRRRENVGRTETTGVEIDLDARLSKRWLAGAGVLLADAKVVDGGRVPQVPRAQGTLQVRYEALRGAKVAAQARFSGPAFEDDLNTLELSGLHVVDLFASVPIVRGLEAFAAAENVLDDRYDAGKTPVTTLGAPRTFRGGVRLTWTPAP